MKNIVTKWIKGLRIDGKPDEWESKKLLELIGLNIPSSRRLLPRETFDAQDFNFPLVLKVCDPEILHKTERGGVLLNVSHENFTSSVNLLKRKFPLSPILAESMCEIEGPEFIIGGLLDPVFGPAVMAGAGGILTELYEDVAFRLCPCSKNEAVRMLNELKIAPILKGYRGSCLDLDALAEAVSCIRNLFDSFAGKLSQIDVNPIVYSGGKWMALDCVFILNK